MTTINHSLLALMTECENKLGSLIQLNPDHELAIYSPCDLTQSENSKLMVQFMKRFCPGIENPRNPNLYQQFIAFRAFVSAVDAAILTDLVTSLARVSPKLIDPKDPGVTEMLRAFHVFIQTVDTVTLTKQSKTNT